MGPTPIQAEALRRLAAGAGRLGRCTGGAWTHPEVERYADQAPKWFVTVHTVRAMEARGWIRRVDQYEEWRDPRVLTDAGRAAAGVIADRRTTSPWPAPSCSTTGTPRRRARELRALPDVRRVGFSEYHKCHPVWLVAIVEGEEQPADDDYCEVRAVDAEAAAAQGAEEDDRNGAEYRIIRAGEGGDYVAWVKAAPDAKPKRFEVTGEAVPQYYAEEIEE